MTEEDKYIEIDLKDIFRRIWTGRRLILKCACAAVVAAIVVAFSIPREYSVVTSIAPETTSTTASGTFNSLASMAGVNIGGSTSRDAVYPMLYPDIVESKPFLTELFSVPVTFTKRRETIETDIYGYFTTYLRSPWWSTVLSLPFRVAGWVKSVVVPEKDEPETAPGQVNPYLLTKKQNAVCKALRKRIILEVDKKTNYVVIRTTVQNPEVAGALSSAVMDKLQKYITDYRTDKARKSVEYLTQMCEKAKADYYRDQSRYASYVDSHQGVVQRSARVEQERLQNEMNITYQLYNQMAQKLQIAEAKVQEETPVFAVINPSYVPLKPSRPSKTKILLVMVVLSVIGSSFYVIIKKH